MAASGFSLLASCEIEGIPAKKYRSLKTGIVVCIAQVKGPIVNGFFCLGAFFRCFEITMHSNWHTVYSY